MRLSDYIIKLLIKQEYGMIIIKEYDTILESFKILII